jgi:hypothetical protein
MLLSDMQVKAWRKWFDLESVKLYSRCDWPGSCVNAVADCGETASHGGDGLRDVACISVPLHIAAGF